MIFQRIILISGPVKLLFHIRQPAPGHHRGLHPEQARMLGFRNVKKLFGCRSCRSYQKLLKLPQQLLLRG
jgi:hypothetical protein